MGNFLSILIVAVFIVLTLGGTTLQPFQFLNFGLAQQQPAKNLWNGRTASGAVITQEGLALSITKHKIWLETRLKDKKEGERANLSGANLSGANLNGADLREAYLSGADLSGADLYQANLFKADLKEANLFKANLSWANLKGADLSGANLKEADILNGRMNQAILKKANLSWAKMMEADLSEADLRNADLSNTNLLRAKLSRADLTKADLKEADLYLAHMRGVKLRDANLTKARLSNADLIGANLYGADLTMAELRGTNLNRSEMSLTILKDADLIRADLSETKLIRADLKGAKFFEANLSGADLFKVNLNGFDLSEVNLSGAHLKLADLSGANLFRANLSRAELSEVNLSGAGLKWANLTNAVFEPDPDKLPAVDSIANAQGLANLWYDNSSQSLVKLRKSFKEAGYRQQEREITCSLKRSDTFQYWKRGGIDRKIIAVFNYVFFDMTCSYGVSPWRPLALLSFFSLIFLPFYCLALKSRRADTGIWLVWLPDRVLDKGLKERPYKLTTRTPFRPLPLDSTRFGEKILRGWRLVRLGFYFSLISAFSMGWKELNVGNWISRIQKREYTLRATGWVRTLSGIQSLISVFLLALWAFLYVGSIFE